MGSLPTLEVSAPPSWSWSSSPSSSRPPRELPTVLSPTSTLPPLDPLPESSEPEETLVLFALDWDSATWTTRMPSFLWDLPLSSPLSSLPSSTSRDTRLSSAARTNSLPPRTTRASLLPPVPPLLLFPSPTRRSWKRSTKRLIVKFQALQNGFANSFCSFSLEMVLRAHRFPHEFPSPPICVNFSGAPPLAIHSKQRSSLKSFCCSQ